MSFPRRLEIWFPRLLALFCIAVVVYLEIGIRRGREWRRQHPNEVWQHYCGYLCKDYADRPALPNQPVGRCACVEAKP